MSKPDFKDADLQILSHVAAFRERGLTEPHPDCYWCEAARKRGFWDMPLRKWRVRVYYEAEVEVSALNKASALHRGEFRAEPVQVESYADDLAAVEAARRGDWEPAIDAYFEDR